MVFIFSIFHCILIWVGGVSFKILQSLWIAFYYILPLDTIILNMYIISVKHVNCTEKINNITLLF